MGAKNDVIYKASEDTLMKIVICDDEKSTCAELERIIMGYASKYGAKLQVDVFLSGDTLTEWLYREEAPEVLFLDIELPGINGVAVGDYIRRILENEQIFIVYISSKKNYAMQLFQNRPFDFLVKPLNEKMVHHVLDNIYRVMGKTDSFFEYSSKGIIYRIPCKDILYFQSIGRKINIVTRKEMKTFYGKLTEVQEAVSEYLFLGIHKSYLINFNYVKEYTYEWVKMLNGDILSISKVNRAEIRKKILERETDEFRNY